MTRFLGTCLAVCFLQIMLIPTGWAQSVPAVDPAATGNADAPPPLPEWRDTTGYPFPAIAQTVERMQFIAYALQLREYCANHTITDKFVQERLQRFSAMTGREENCKSLLDY